MMRATKWAFAPALALLISLPASAESILSEGKETTAHLDFRITIPAVLHPQSQDAQEPARSGLQRRVERLADGRERVTLAWP